MCKRDLEGKKMGNRIMTIQFFIDYGMSSKREYSNIFSNLDTENIKIQLERFSSKLKTGEKYSKSKHKSRVLTFNSDDKSKFGFKIDIGDINFRKSRAKLNFGCQLISIYSNFDDVDVLEDSISKVVDRFKHLFGIQDFKDTAKYGYRFKVEIKRFDDQPSIFIYYSLFKVDNQSNFTVVNFENIDVADYHINKLESTI